MEIVNLSLEQWRLSCFQRGALSYSKQARVGVWSIKNVLQCFIHIIHNYILNQHLLSIYAIVRMCNLANNNNHLIMIFRENAKWGWSRGRSSIIEYLITVIFFIITNFFSAKPVFCFILDRGIPEVIERIVGTESKICWFRFAVFTSGCLTRKRCKMDHGLFVFLSGSARPCLPARWHYI